jgi:hypothetical protein
VTWKSWRAASRSRSIGGYLYIYVLQVQVRTSHARRRAGTVTK